jgi:hypothetical protein
MAVRARAVTEKVPCGNTQAPLGSYAAFMAVAAADFLQIRYKAGQRAL